MAEYRGIKGFNIQSLSSDPTGSADTEGQVWYNTTSKTLKGIVAVAGSGSWSSGGALGTGRVTVFSFGTQTTAICASGYGPASTNVANTESYNGTAWSEVNDVNSAFRETGGSFGTSTAGIKAGGRPSGVVATESWDGTCWTAANDMTELKSDSGSGCGIQTAGIIYGGDGAPTNTQEYEGTSWANVGALNTGRSYLGRGGVTVPAALCCGGQAPPTGTALVESYNGTSWTEVNNINTARSAMTGGGPAAGGAILAGGTPGYQTSAETWDGTCWTTAASLASGRYGAGTASNGSSTANIAFGGTDGSFMTSTEEWTVAANTYAVKTFTSS